MRRIALAAAAFAALAVAPAAEARGCGNADANPAHTSVKQLRHATVCLLNKQRRHRGLHRLRQNPGLVLAGQRHALDMVERRYFSHSSTMGTPFTARIRRTGYLRRSGRTLLGENLAYGGRELATPRQIVRSWMRSPGHRANILRARFREIGIAIVEGAPRAGVDDALTYVTEFGVR